MTLTRDQSAGGQSTETYRDLTVTLGRAHPESSVFILERARVELAQDKLSLVEEHLETLLKRDPHFVPARALLAVVALRGDDTPLRVRQLMMSSDDFRPSDLAHYALTHPKDLINYGWLAEADKFVNLCIDQARHVEAIDAQFECAQINLVSRLWRGALYTDTSPLNEYAARLSSAELDEHSRRYFKGIELYIRAELALRGGRLDEATRLGISLSGLSANMNDS